MALQWDDDRLLAELGEALQSAGETPEWVTRAGEAAWSWRTVDEELALATLVFDSTESSEPLVRSAVGAPANRLLEFRGGGLTLQLTESGDVLLGQVDPGGPGTVTVERPDGTSDSVPVDELGCFDLPKPTTPFRLLCTTADGGLVTGLLRL